MSEYEKKRDKALFKLSNEDTGLLGVSAFEAFKAGSDFGREYIKAEYDQLIKELEWYKEKFESAANDANESRQAYNQLMQDARALREAIKLAADQVTWYSEPTYGNEKLYTYGYHVAKCQEALKKFDKKYPQVNEKETKV